MSREQITGAAIVSLIVALLIAAAVPVARDWDELRPRVSGDPAPSFELPHINADGTLGEGLALESLRGRVVLVDFWATWCGPCRASMPRLEALKRRFGARGLELLSINTEGPRKAESARKMVDRLSPSAVLVSDRGHVADAYGVTSIPHLALISKTGTIRWVHRGGLSSRASKRLASEIERLLE